MYKTFDMCMIKVVYQVKNFNLITKAFPIDRKFELLDLSLV